MAPSELDQDNTEEIDLYPEAQAEAELQKTPIPEVMVVPREALPDADEDGEDEDAGDDEDEDAEAALFGTETMAELYARQGKLGQAIAIFQRLIERDPSSDRLAQWQERCRSLERARAHAGDLEIISESKAPPPAPVRKTAAAANGGQSLPVPTPTDAPATSEHRLPLIVAQPVRSGQVVYAQGSDLIVLGPVNPGGQVVADGHIHIYGPLRGRAVAGAQGCAEARIFCQKLEPELLAINGIYLVFDDLPPECVGKAAHIEARDGTCIVKLL